ncbi:unnamed protein product [Meloidogyne enterolobii]|uniref:Uncharacterized protein n=1 Tax=Meloidogyne enterolobii TaxID=390850 RepID=A0ACB1B608_MELEN
MIKRKNEISIKRLQLCEQYFLLMRNVETLLFECHLNIAKTRKILDIPVSFDTALSISDDKIESSQSPTVWLAFIPISIEDHSGLSFIRVMKRRMIMMCFHLIVVRKLRLQTQQGEDSQI